MVANGRGLISGKWMIHSVASAFRGNETPFGKPLERFDFNQTTLFGQWTVFNMANLQRAVISVLLILTAAFLFLAQTTQAAKGPKITHKVKCSESVLYFYSMLMELLLGLL